MTIEMLDVATSAGPPPPDAARSTVSTAHQGDMTIPESLLDELADIVADALVASIDRDLALVTADC